MKKLSLLIPILAAIALFSQPVLAEDTHQHETTTQAAQGETAAPDEKMNAHESMMQASMKKMQAQMASINQVKDPKKRLKLLQEHSKSMRDSIKMMHDMMGDMTMGCPMMGGGMMGGGMMGGGMMGGGMMGGGMMGGGMMGGGMMGGGMMGGNPASQAGDNASAVPAAQTSTDKTATTGKISTKEGGKLWTCPMHPDVVRDQPGLCPICGMELVEKDPSGTSPSGHSHTMGCCMKGNCMGGDMKGGCMGGGMKGGCMGGGMKGGGMKGGGMMGGGMMGMTGKHMDMMLMLMEQMIEHNEAAMAVRK